MGKSEFWQRSILAIAVIVSIYTVLGRKNMNDIAAIYIEKAFSLLHKKYIEAIRIYDLTKQMNDSLNHNDVVSTQLYLNMRQDVIIIAATIDEEVLMMIDSMSEEMQRRMKQLVGPQWKDLHGLDAAETKVGEEWERVWRQLQKTIEMDKVFASKVGGKDSYYSQKEKGLL